MSPKPQNINLTFADGRVSKIDEDVHRLILEFQREIKLAKSALPFFWDLSSSLKDHSELLLEFYSYAIVVADSAAVDSGGGSFECHWRRWRWSRRRWR